MYAAESRVLLGKLVCSFSDLLRSKHKLDLRTQCGSWTLIFYFYFFCSKTYILYIITSMINDWQSRRRWRVKDANLLEQKEEDERMKIRHVFNPLWTEKAWCAKLTFTVLCIVRNHLKSGRILKRLPSVWSMKWLPLQPNEVSVIRGKCVLLEVRSLLCGEPNDFSFFVLITSCWQASLNWEIVNSSKRLSKDNNSMFLDNIFWINLII